MKYILLFLFTVFNFTSYSQNLEHAWVYLTDKDDVAASIANPIIILS